MADDLQRRVQQLTESRTPYARATVVRVQAPTSARAGDTAVVTADGAIEGFVGGQCVLSTVRLAAVDALSTGEPRLLRILPDDHDVFPEVPGADVSINTCLSQGAVEVFVQPVLPPPIVSVAGDTPIARAVVDQARLIGYEADCTPVEQIGEPHSVREGALALVVATHGEREVTAIRQGLDQGIPYIGLVASKRRGAQVLAELDLGTDELAHLHTPVGLRIGASTPAEVALSIMAEVVKAVSQDGLTPVKVEESPDPETALDPVCGMTVAVSASSPSATVDGVRHWFCQVGCRDRFIASAGGQEDGATCAVLPNPMPRDRADARS